MHNDLYSWLQNDPVLFAQFGDRIFHEWSPQSETTWPQLVFQQTSGSEFAVDFDSLGQQNLEQAFYQFDCYARSSAVCLSASNALVSQLRLLRGTIGGVDIQHTELVNTIHLGEIVGDKQVRRISSDFLFYFNLSEV